MSTTSEPLTRPGDYIADTIGSTEIRVEVTVDLAFHLYVQAGPNRIDELCTTYTDKTLACRRASRIRAALLADTPIWQLIEQAQAEAQAALAQVAEVLDDTLAAEINATMDAVHNQRATAAGELARDVAAILAPTRQTTAAPTTNAMDRLLIAAAARKGQIGRGSDPDTAKATVKQLIALEARGLVTLTYGRQRNTRVISGGWLTLSGWKRAHLAD